MERTAKDFVDDMLNHGRDWIAILSVASAVRNGRWYSDTRTMLQERGIMPKDPEEAKKQREASIKKASLQLPPSRYIHGKAKEKSGTPTQ